MAEATLSIYPSGVHDGEYLVQLEKRNSRSRVLSLAVGAADVDARIVKTLSDIDKLDNLAQGYGIESHLADVYGHMLNAHLALRGVFPTESQLSEDIAA